ncbi:HAD family hydrolase [Furfurilactobacillus entadae]|uniref:HAD family hydrolase n=1 Tax=Furfurilactobacillus entadae TaxID=2922307 RepID=UPI0035E75A1F
MIKHIFSDMDNTLLDSQGHLSEHNATVIKSTHIPFTLVSARAPMEMMFAINQLHLATPQIAFNGGLIFSMENRRLVPLVANSIETTVVQQILGKLGQRFPTVSVSCYGQNCWYAEKIDQGITTESRLTGQSPTLTSFSQLLNQPQLHIFKIMMMFDEEQTLHHVQDYFLKMDLPGIIFQQSGPVYLEVTSALAQKSVGIHFIQEREHLQTEELPAFGDGHNDLPMLNSVGHPIVMANANPEIKQIAEFITTDNDSNGVAYGIQHLLAAEKRKL